MTSPRQSQRPEPMPQMGILSRSMSPEPISILANGSPLLQKRKASFSGPLLRRSSIPSKDVTISMAPGVGTPYQMISQDIHIDTYVSVTFVRIVVRFRSTEPNGASRGIAKVWLPEGGCITSFSAETPDGRSLVMRYVPTQSIKPGSAQPLPTGGSPPINPNEFSCQIYEVAAGEIITVDARYFYQAECSQDTFVISLPFCFPREQRDLTTISGRVFWGPANIKIASVTHALEVQDDTTNMWRVTGELNATTTDVFSLTYTVTREEGAHAHLLVDNSSNFCVVFAPPKLVGGTNLPREVVFLLDVSGSMSGRALRLAKKALTQAITSLRHSDVFNVIVFNHVSVPLSKAWVASLDNASVAKILQTVEGVDASGGTNILAPLTFALEGLKASVRHPFVFLITDGAVANERTICQVAGLAKYKGVRVNTLGIGNYCNTYFLKMLASQGRGYSLHCADVASLGCKVLNLFEGIDAAIMTDTTIDFGAGASATCYPRVAPDVFGGQPFVVAGTIVGDLNDSDMAITGTTANVTKKAIRVPMTKFVVPACIPLDMVSAKMRLDDKTSQAWLSESLVLEQEAVSMSCAYGLSCPHTTPVVFETTAEQQKREAAVNQETSVALMLCAVAGSLLLASTIGQTLGNVAATIANLSHGACILDAAGTAAATAVEGITDGSAAEGVADGCDCDCSGCDCSGCDF